MSSVTLTPIQKVHLYRHLLQQAKQLTNYNFREYALRRTKDGFRMNQTVSDPAKVQQLVQYAQEDFEVLKRQVIVSRLYKNDKLVIE